MTDGGVFISVLVVVIWVGIPLTRIARAVERVAGDVRALRDLADRRRP